MPHLQQFLIESEDKMGIATAAAAIANAAARVEHFIDRIWPSFSSIVTVIATLVALVSVSPIPFFDRNSATLMMPTKEAQMGVARALSQAVELTGTLDTEHLDRFLFRDGTSIDLLKRSAFEPMYRIVGIKTVVIPFWRSFFTSPVRQAEKVRKELKRQGHRVQVVLQPDPAAPSGSVVLVLSDAFMYDAGNGRKYGSAFLLRYHALYMSIFIGGPAPKIGNPFN